MPKRVEIPDPIEVGPWFTAAFEGECDECGSLIDEGETIRAVPSGYQGYECCGRGDEEWVSPDA